MDTFGHSSFGMVAMTLFQSLFTAPSWATFTYLACGWALATDQHTITTSVWLTEATTVKHFSRFCVFLGRPLYHADGGYATKDSVRQLPTAAHVVGCFPISAKLYELPPPPTPKRRGAPHTKGDLIGSPKTLAPGPSAAGAALQAWCGLWHAVLPRRLIRIVMVRQAWKPVGRPSMRPAFFPYHGSSLNWPKSRGA